MANTQQASSNEITNAAAVVDEDAATAAATAMLERLEALTKSPYSYELHAANVKAANSDEERDEARNFMNQMVPMPEELWMQWIQEKKQRALDEPSLEASIEVLEIYKRACNDYLCVFSKGSYMSVLCLIWFMPSLQLYASFKTMPNSWFLCGTQLAATATPQFSNPTMNRW